MRSRGALAGLLLAAAAVTLAVVLPGGGKHQSRVKHQGRASHHGAGKPQRAGKPRGAGKPQGGGNHGAPPRSKAFGADVGVLFQSRYPAVVVDRALAGAAQAGLGLARVAPLWELTEPSPPHAGRHRYSWSYDDFIARELSSHGFRWVAVLAFAPGWASQTPRRLHGAPRSVGGFAAYAGAVARRYRGLIAAYEVWNEENSRAFWRPRPDPAAYARLYVAARAAIRHFDRRAPVLIGGLADGPPGFLARVLKRPRMRGGVDGVAVHPYGADPRQVIARVRGYRRTLHRLGLGRLGLYVTEYGWATRPVGNRTYAPAAGQGPWIAQTAQELLGSDCGVPMAIFYAWVTPRRDPAAVDQWYGIEPPSGGSSPATAAVAQASRGLLRARPARAALCAVP